MLFNESDHAIEKKPDENEEDTVKRYVEFDCQESYSEGSTEQDIQRSTRVRKTPDYYGEWATLTNNQTTEPKTVKDVFRQGEMEGSYEERDGISLCKCDRTVTDKAGVSLT